MSFGFGVGDIVAVGELAHKLYKNVYLVAKYAPQELDALARDLSLFKGAIGLLREEVDDPDSVLNSGGQARVTMVNEMMINARKTLVQLEGFATKHDIIQSGKQRKQIKKSFDRLLYAGDASKISALRAQIIHHHALINLLLTSIGKLERPVSGILTSLTYVNGY